MTTHGSHHDQHGHGDVHEHDRGLSHDLPILLNRRRLLGFLGGAGALTLAGCGIDPAAERTAGASPTAGPTAAGPTTAGATTAGATTAGATTAGAADGTEIPEETAGPFPGNGSNGVNVLAATGIVRSDITTSFGGPRGVAAGVPLAVRLKVVDADNASAPLPGAAVYLWHCDIAGRYSLYDRGVAAENYLRGVQAADSAGWVTFTSIYPGAYRGRWPHMHFEVYRSLAAATAAGDKLRTSQLALPEDVSTLVYATDGYAGSARNLSAVSLADDTAFRDGYSLQMATVTGSVASGFTATLNVPV